MFNYYLELKRFERIIHITRQKYINWLWHFVAVDSIGIAINCNKQFVHDNKGYLQPGERWLDSTTLRIFISCPAHDRTRTHRQMSQALVKPYYWRKDFNDITLLCLMFLTRTSATVTLEFSIYCTTTTMFIPYTVLSFI